MGARLRTASEIAALISVGAYGGAAYEIYTFAEQHRQYVNLHSAETAVSSITGYFEGLGGTIVASLDSSSAKETVTSYLSKGGNAFMHELSVLTNPSLTGAVEFIFVGTVSAIVASSLRKMDMVANFAEFGSRFGAAYNLLSRNLRDGTSHVIPQLKRAK